MKIIKLFAVLTILVFTLNSKSQSCSANFVYTLNPNGNITFSNVSVTSSPTLTTTYIWDTGNGMTFTTNSLSQNISTTYTSSGTYSIYLSMQTSSLGCNGGTLQVINFSIPGCPLSASIAVPQTNLSSASVSFSDASTGTISNTSYTWKFGDGTTSNAVNPTHVYSGNGIFGYSLTTSNNGTCSSFFNVTANEAYNGPTHICAYVPSISYTPNASGVVNFTANGIFNPPGLNSVVWYFGDNLFSAGNANPSHTYFNGIYTPTLSVYIGGQCGLTVKYTAGPIAITNNSCSTNAAFTYTTGTGGFVQFSKTSPTSNTNTAYLWNFGDGIVSSQVNPNHTYSSAGNYSVTLRSYDLAYPMLGNYPEGDTFLVSLPCRKFNRINLNVTGIPCIANSNFTISPFAPHQYWIQMQYPYNINAASWSWGDGSTTTVQGFYANHTYAAAGTYDICVTVTTSCGMTSTSCMSQYLAKGTVGDMVNVYVQQPELTTGIEEAFIENLQLELFPNPSNDGVLNIRLNQEATVKNIEIYDLFGKCIYTNAISSGKDLIRLELPELSDGIYFIRLKLPQQSITSKFIIDK